MRKRLKSQYGFPSPAVDGPNESVMSIMLTNNKIPTIYRAGNRGGNGNKNSSLDSFSVYSADVKQVIENNENSSDCLSFCPRYLERYLQTKLSKSVSSRGVNQFQGEKRGHKVESEGFSRHDCLLLVDISGFTKLSSTLCTQGPSGIDRLRKITDHSLAQFVECVYLSGGDGKL